MANAWMWAIAAGGVLGAAWVFVLWRAVGLLRSLAGLEDRVARLTDALALLADTTETGFRSLTEQLVPVAAAAAPGPRRAEQADSHHDQPCRARIEARTDGRRNRRRRAGVGRRSPAASQSRPGCRAFGGRRGTAGAQDTEAKGRQWPAALGVSAAPGVRTSLPGRAA